MGYNHISVLKEETLEYLNPQPGQNFVDCTLGRGGHTSEFLKQVGDKGKVLAIDLDTEAIKAVKPKNNLILVQDNFKNLENIYKENLDGLPIHGILLDLGVSSPQFDDPERGFSFREDGKLDMNFDKESKVKAFDLIKYWSQKDLERIFRDYGEEKFAGRIAANIVEEREHVEIFNTKHLAELITNSIPAKFRFKSKIHPATRVFQALRIAVNDELESLRQVLPQAINVLATGGRLAVISFHSLEDRIVKQFFVEQSKGCICPPAFPICQCNNSPKVKILTRKPIIASAEEIENNPRSRSAKLRVIEKL